MATARQPPRYAATDKALPMARFGRNHEKPCSSTWALDASHSREGREMLFTVDVTALECLTFERVTSLMCR